MEFIKKKSDSVNFSDKKMSTEEFQAYFDFSQSCLDLTKGDSRTIDWTPTCQEASDKLKYALICAPVLAYSIYSYHLILATDVSKYAAGAILSQVEGIKR
jgi:hypothetical protein